MVQGLSNQEIAGKLHLTHGTVKWYASQIYGKLGVKSRAQAIVRSQDLGLLDAATSEPQAKPRQVHSYLPVPLTSFVGRERDIREIKQLLDTHRLVTLSGSGGSGKTRLAIEIARRVEHHYEDGAHFVSLASLTHARYVVNTIAAALGIQETAGRSLTDVLLNDVRHKHLLLVLDNFEHIIDGAPILSLLLQAAPQVQILVTSREILRLSGEQEYGVAPLELVSVEEVTSFDQVRTNEALTLFLHRARSVHSEFTLTETNASAIVEITHRLDGLPLALELAAARIRLFTPQQLLERLDRRLDVLMGGMRDLPERQQTLRSAIAWSFNLLNDDEKTLFLRLAIFRGGSNLDAVASICAPGLETDVLIGLESLLNKSLIHMDEGQDGESRFTMLETIHEYARELLDASGTFVDLASRHANYFATLVERLESDMRGNDEERAVMRIEADGDNLRSALDRSFGDSDVTVGLRILAVLGYFWTITSRYIEGDNWFEMGWAKRHHADPLLRVRLLLAGSLIGYSLGKAEETIAYLKEALQIARHLNEKSLIGQSLQMLSIFCIGLPDEYDRAMAMMQEALALSREVGHRPQIGEALNVLGELERAMGNFQAAKQYYEESLAIISESGVQRRIRLVYQNLGSIALNEGDYQRAEKYLRQCITDVTSYDRFALLSALSALAAAYAA